MNLQSEKKEYEVYFPAIEAEAEWLEVDANVAGRFNTLPGPPQEYSRVPYSSNGMLRWASADAENTY